MRHFVLVMVMISWSSCPGWRLELGMPVKAESQLQFIPRGTQLTDWYSSNGSPTCSISGMVQRRSNAFDKTILKIYQNVSMLA